MQTERTEAMKSISAEDGWTEWTVCSPPYGILCEFFRSGWAERTVARREEFSPHSNIALLYWRITGIGHEEMAAWNAQQWALWEMQSMINFSWLANSLLPSWAMLGLSQMGGTSISQLGKTRLYDAG